MDGCSRAQHRRQKMDWLVNKWGRIIFCGNKGLTRIKNFLVRHVRIVGDEER